MRKFSRTARTHKKQRSLAEMFRRFMIEKRTEGLARATLDQYEETYGYLLDYLDGDIPNEDVTTETFANYVSYMMNDRGLSPVTVNVRVRPMRAFLRFCYEEDWIYEPIHEKFKPVKTPDKHPETFTEDEVNLLFEAMDDTRFRGFRNKVMTYVALDTMVRISELSKMKRHNVNLDTGYIQLEAHETKTKRERLVPLSNATIKLLAQYMEETEDFEAEALFLTYDGRPFNQGTYRKDLVEYKEMVGIKKRVSPHIFRHTGALFYILNGGDPFSLQQILGHTSQDMVRRYVNMADVQLKRQHNEFSPLNNLNRRKSGRGKATIKRK